MTIKLSAEDAYFADHPEERKLAQGLNEGFDVTYGRSHGDLGFWLAEPHAHVRERFGLRQEILVLYSPHTTTDARILTAIENITRNPDFKHRIDKVVFLLIHNGDSHDTEELVGQQQDRIIVPITAADLLNPHRGPLFLRTKLASAIGAIDLFSMSSPIRSDNYFFGRDELVQLLLSRSVVYHENSGLFGLRKTGKTSVLFALERRLADRATVVSQYLECENPGIHAARWWQVLEGLVVRIKDTLQKQHRRTVTVHASDSSNSYSQTNAGLLFSSDISTILHDGNREQIVVMLDEVEWITPGLSGALGQHWDDDFVPFWRTIRAIHQETGGRLSFIVAGVNPTCVERSHFGTTPNPIFQLALPQYLEPLSTKNVRDMVRSIGRYAGLRFEEPVYEHLKDAYGGHPYLIRIVCSEIWKTTDIDNPTQTALVKVENFHKQHPKIEARLSNPIRDILLSLVWWYPEEYDLLQILAQGDADFVRQYMESEPDMLLQFARFGILREGAGTFAITDLRDFLNKHGKAYKSELSPFARGDIPPQLLPEVPDIELLGQLFKKRTEVELSLRKAITLYLGFTCNWDPKKIAASMLKGISVRPDRKSPPELFVGRTPQVVINDLYTSDLKSIIVANWDTFGPLFDNKKGRFDMNMDTLNIARRVDAHAHPVTSDEVIEFENSYAWLQTRLAKLPSA